MQPRRKRSRRSREPPSRSEQKDAAARAALVPLEPGERPVPVTIGAIVAAALGLSNLGLYIAGVDIRGEGRERRRRSCSVRCMLTAAWGMWRVRYWAVLGMQALLGLVILVFSLVAMTAASVWALLLALAIVASAGTLFWFMVKAMARIQMPTPRSVGWRAEWPSTTA